VIIKDGFKFYNGGYKKKKKNIISRIDPHYVTVLVWSYFDPWYISIFVVLTSDFFFTCSMPYIL